MDEVRWFVSTYNASRYPESVEQNRCREHGSPHVPVLMCQEEGIRVILGSHDRENRESPDVLIERQPGGWVLFIHPIGGGDPSGFVYLRDDGHSFVQPESEYGSSPQIETLEPFAPVPGFEAAE